MNKSKRVSLDVINIASPCPAAWDEMLGDDRVRFCGECRLNVYNLSEMNRAEAELFLSQREGRTCIRIYRRADGTIMTRDCPVGLRAVRQKLARMVAAIAAVIGGLTVSTLFGRSPASVGDVLRAGPMARFAAWLEPSYFTIAGAICIPRLSIPEEREDALSPEEMLNIPTPVGGSDGTAPTH